MVGLLWKMIKISWFGGTLIVENPHIGDSTCYCYVFNHVNGNGHKHWHIDKNSLGCRRSCGWTCLPFPLLWIHSIIYPIVMNTLKCVKNIWVEVKQSHNGIMVAPWRRAWSPQKILWPGGDATISRARSPFGTGCDATNSSLVATDGSRWWIVLNSDW